MSAEREAFEAWFAENRQPSYLSAWSAWQARLAGDALAAIAAQAAELARMRARIESLRGLCKTAVGLLHDAGRDDDADRVHALIGDMEPAND